MVLICSNVLSCQSIIFSYKVWFDLVTKTQTRYLSGLVAIWATARFLVARQFELEERNLCVAYTFAIRDSVDQGKQTKCGWALAKFQTRPTSWHSVSVHSDLSVRQKLNGHTQKIDQYQVILQPRGQCALQCSRVIIVALQSFFIW